MPYGEPHHRQKRKNWALFAILVTIFVLIYAVSLMRMGASAGGGQ